MLKYTTTILLFISLIGCFDTSNEVIYLASGSHNYMCDDYIVDESSGYRLEDKLKYNIKFIQLKQNKDESDIDIFGSRELINSKLNPYNFYFDLSAFKTEVLPELIEKRVRYRNILKSYWETEGYGSITIVVIPDTTVLIEGKGIQGAAYGVPLKHDPSKGKPILFIKRKHLTNAILIHEILHIFGGLHVFQMHEYLRGVSTCATGDYVLDTPAPSPGHGVSSKTCSFHKGDGSTLTRDDEKILVHNFLSYSGPSCMESVTIGQIERFKYIASIHSLLKAAEVNKTKYSLFEEELPLNEPQ